MEENMADLAASGGRSPSHRMAESASTRRGHLDEFGMLYDRAFDPLCRLAFVLLGDRAAAQDVVQDAFAKVLTRWASIDYPATYVRAAVVNGCRDVLRRRQRFARLRSRSTNDIIDGPHEYLLDALARLPVDQRTAVTLRFYEDMTVDAIAHVMGRKTGTVKSLIHRGLARLKEVIEQ
jgi:RNA polymerase sigma factor (sigma-70 family)